jgi:hypothetical protein
METHVRIDVDATSSTGIANVEGAVYVHDTGVMRDVAAALGNSADATLYAGELTRVQNDHAADRAELPEHDQRRRDHDHGVVGLPLNAFAQP